MFQRFSSYFVPNKGAGSFVLSNLFWGVSSGCFAAVLNNYLSDVRNLNEMERGALEFFRELPGLLLVFLLALMHKYTDWKIFKIGTLVAIVGVAGLVLSADKVFITALIMIWSTGEHILLPTRSAITMRIAKEGMIGRALGLITSVINAGMVSGSMIAALIFSIGISVYHVQNQFILYNIVWGFIVVLLIISVISLCRTKNEDGKNVHRPPLFIHKKYTKFYALELFYGARKQIFITFAPYVLVRLFQVPTAHMAALACICALVNIFCAPVIGKLTDKVGYKNIMIWDTVILFFVCLIYGYADKLFAMQTAFVIVCVNYLLDAVISTTSMATNVYVREIAADKEEITATLSTGISMNHLISILAALGGGYIWHKYGVGVLFSFAAVMALVNSAFAMTLPTPLALRK